MRHKAWETTRRCRKPRLRSLRSGSGLAEIPSQSLESRACDSPGSDAVLRHLSSNDGESQQALHRPLFGAEGLGLGVRPWLERGSSFGFGPGFCKFTHCRILPNICWQNSSMRDERGKGIDVHRILHLPFERSETRSRPWRNLSASEPRLLQLSGANPR